MSAYDKKNGNKMNIVIWYSSTSKVWGSSTKLKEYISRYKPDYILISLGANELFVKDIKTKRKDYVNNMLSQIGEIPYIWIGPPNWKDDTGINELIGETVKKGTFFVSNGMKFDRAKDGAHPTRSSAVLWMDSVARWIQKESIYPIKLEVPAERLGKCPTVILQPAK